MLACIGSVLRRRCAFVGMTGQSCNPFGLAYFFLGVFIHSFGWGFGVSMIASNLLLKVQGCFLEVPSVLFSRLISRLSAERVSEKQVGELLVGEGYVGELQDNEPII